LEKELINSKNEIFDISQRGGGIAKIPGWTTLTKKGQTGKGIKFKDKESR